MGTDPGRTGDRDPPHPARPEDETRVAVRLERGEVVYYAVCPFALPEGEDHGFLLAQRLAGGRHKNISYDPHTGAVSGFRRQGPGEAERLRELLAAFSRAATGWLAGLLPGYARAWRTDRASFRPEEEATRRLRTTARNDLLHVDAFPTRPTDGDRILRLFVNVNPAEPRVWVTSEPFAVLFGRFGEAAGLPHPGNGEGWLRSFLPFRSRRRSDYDAFMLRFHDYLKGNDVFQERGPKRVWKFPPGSCWVAFTDTCSHAVLRGRYALEHSYFVAPHGLALPEESPASLLARACAAPALRRAA